MLDLIQYPQGGRTIHNHPCKSQHTKNSRYNLIYMPQIKKEIHKININGKHVSYTLQRSRRRRRTIQLQVNQEEGIKLLVPDNMQQRDIQKFLESRTDWIIQHMYILEHKENSRKWHNGEKIPFRGKELTLGIDIAPAGIYDRFKHSTAIKSLEGDEIRIKLRVGVKPDEISQEVAETIYKWYRQEALIYLKDRIATWAEITGWQPSRVRISDARRRWGSCSNKKSINLNWRLILLPDELSDYVLVHELAHIKELNHSRNFWKYVESILPDWRERRNAIRQHSTSASI